MKEYTGLELLQAYKNNELGKIKSIQDTYNKRYCEFNENGVLRYEGEHEVNTCCILKHTFEVEIIEEIKGIKKLDFETKQIMLKGASDNELELLEGIKHITRNLVDYRNKINELIEVMNKKIRRISESNNTFNE